MPTGFSEPHTPLQSYPLPPTADSDITDIRWSGPGEWWCLVGLRDHDSPYGSEGWGFESLRAHSLRQRRIRPLACGNAVRGPCSCVGSERRRGDRIPYNHPYVALQETDGPSGADPIRVLGGRSDAGRWGLTATGLEVCPCEGPRIAAFAAATGAAPRGRCGSGVPECGRSGCRSGWTRPRLHVPVDEVRALIGHAEQEVRAARRAADGRGPWTRQAADLHRAEQVLLLVRLAADSGARRGELAALQFGDLDGRVLTISRGTSLDVVGQTKTGRIRRMTPRRGSKDCLGAGARFGPWVFSADSLHRQRLTTSGLGHWFSGLCQDAEQPQVTLHRLRHSVATALVSRGDILAPSTDSAMRMPPPPYGYTATPSRWRTSRPPTSWTTSTRQRRTTDFGEHLRSHLRRPQ
jgi:hypothetical protein